MRFLTHEDRSGFIFNVFKDFFLNVDHFNKPLFSLSEYFFCFLFSVLVLNPTQCTGRWIHNHWPQSSPSVALESGPSLPFWPHVFLPPPFSNPETQMSLFLIPILCILDSALTFLTARFGGSSPPQHLLTALQCSRLPLLWAFLTGSQLPVDSALSTDRFPVTCSFCVRACSSDSFDPHGP